MATNPEDAMSESVVLDTNGSPGLSLLNIISTQGVSSKLLR